MQGAPDTLDLRDHFDLSDDLDAIAARVADRYRAVRRTVDTTGTLFARYELQSALIEVRRLRRNISATSIFDADLAKRR